MSNHKTLDMNTRSFQSSKPVLSDYRGFHGVKNPLILVIRLFGYITLTNDTEPPVIVVSNLYSLSCFV